MDQQLSIHDTLVGRTLGRITPKVQDDLHSPIDIDLVAREFYSLHPLDNTKVHDLFINTMHRAVPIAYVSFAPDHEINTRWSLTIGAPRWVMFHLCYTPGNAARPLESFELKKVSHA